MLNVIGLRSLFISEKFESEILLVSKKPRLQTES